MVDLVCQTTLSKPDTGNVTVQLTTLLVINQGHHLEPLFKVLLLRLYILYVQPQTLRSQQPLLVVNFFHINFSSGAQASWTVNSFKFQRRQDFSLHSGLRMRQFRPWLGAIFCGVLVQSRGCDRLFNLHSLTICIYTHGFSSSNIASARIPR